jgi:hypothetical protein
MMESFDERVGKKTRRVAMRFVLPFHHALTAGRAGAWIVHQRARMRALPC